MKHIQKLIVTAILVIALVYSIDDKDGLLIKCPQWICHQTLEFLLEWEVSEIWTVFELVRVILEGGT